MHRQYKLWLFIVSMSLIAVQPLMASNFQVGTCKAKLKSFATISAAVSSASSGSTIYVCPGTYPEQVTITQSLNLVGVAAGTADQAVITIPSGGLTANTTSMFGQSVAAQVLVEGAGWVNIANITVDGTGGDLGCNANTWVAGIFFGSISSGNVNHVKASNQTDTQCGVGIWGENSDSSSQRLAIENSTVFNADSVGIFVASGATPSLSVQVNNNFVSPSSQSLGIAAESVEGQLRGNIISNAELGILDEAPAVTANGNTIVTSGYGMFLLGGSAGYNRILGSNIGVVLAGPGASLTGNSIVSSGTEAIEMGCFSASLSQNVINDAPVGIDQAPSGGVGTTIFRNTATTTTGSCQSGLLAAHVRAASSFVPQWHTPAMPFGTRLK